jgi:hypothetical protein
MSKLILATGAENISITVTPEFSRARETALDKTALVINVEDDQSAASAIEAAQVAKGLIKAIETQRVEIKAPFLKAGKDIDEAARVATSQLYSEVKRIESLVGSHEQRKRDAIRAEQQRIATENAAREQAAREARQKAEEAAKKAAEAKSAAAKKKAEAEAVAASRAALAAEVAAAEVEEAPEDAKGIEGAAVTETFGVEITDIAALYKAHPNAVKLEPRLSVINDMIKAGIRDIPGVKLTPVAKVAARAVNPNLTLR